MRKLNPNPNSNTNHDLDPYTISQVLEPHPISRSLTLSSLTLTLTLTLTLIPFPGRRRCLLNHDLNLEDRTLTMLDTSHDLKPEYNSCIAGSFYRTY